MPRTGRSGSEEACHDVENQRLDHVERRLAVLRLVHEYRNDPWLLWEHLEAMNVTDEELAIYSQRQFDPRTRGLPETACRVDYQTGECRCLHPHRAPVKLDCRQTYCPHSDEMRTRLLGRHGTVALEGRRYEGQLSSPPATVASTADASTPNERSANNGFS